MAGQFLRKNQPKGTSRRGGEFKKVRTDKKNAEEKAAFQGEAIFPTPTPKMNQRNVRHDLEAGKKRRRSPRRKNAKSLLSVESSSTYQKRGDVQEKAAELQSTEQHSLRGAGA